MRDKKRFSVTLSMDVYSWINKKAKNNSRSMSGEISEIMKKAKASQ